MIEGTAPLVSVIITTRNRVRVLPLALASVYAQDYPRLEILVLDDASQDGTSDYVRSHHPDIRLFRFDQNSGQTVGRNLLMKEARGEYVVCLDDDAYFPHDDTISRVAARMEGEAELAVIAFRVVTRDAEAPDKAEREYYTNCYWGCGVCIRKAVLPETGYYRELAWGVSEESDLALRIIDKGYRLVYFPRATIVHGVSVAARSNLGEVAALAARLRLLHAWLNEPFPWWVMSTLNALIKYSIQAAWRGRLRNVLRGFGQAVREFPVLKSSRQPVSSRAMRIYFTLSRGKKICDDTAIRALYLNPPGAFGILLRLGS